MENPQEQVGRETGEKGGGGLGADVRKRSRTHAAGGEESERFIQKRNRISASPDRKERTP